MGVEYKKSYDGKSGVYRASCKGEKGCNYDFFRVYDTRAEAEKDYKRHMTRELPLSKGGKTIGKITEHEMQLRNNKK